MIFRICRSEDVSYPASAQSSAPCPAGPSQPAAGAFLLWLRETSCSVPRTIPPRMASYPPNSSSTPTAAMGRRGSLLLGAMRAQRPVLTWYCGLFESGCYKQSVRYAFKKRGRREKFSHLLPFDSGTQRRKALRSRREVVVHTLKCVHRRS